MSMSVGTGGEDEPMMEINTTPLIDVMLVLLIMFIITIPVMTHAVKLDMPQPNQNPPPQTEEPVVIDLEIDFDGTILWNGTPTSMSSLESYFRTEAQKSPQPELHVRPNRRAKYDVVANVLAAAQRNGITRIGFVGNEQFM
jgi:biopolymer transport protein ExbD